MAHSQSPRFSQLFRTLRTPGHRRGVLVRRTIALVLLIAALVSAVSSAKELPQVLVFSKDLPAGAELSASDVSLERLPSSSVPSSALAGSPSDLAGRIITAAAGKGEVVTSQRLLGQELVSSLVAETGSADSAQDNFGRMIPVKLADPDIIPHLQHGDAVDIVTTHDATDAHPTTARVIASGARVVSTTTAEGEISSATVLLALPNEHANDVAAASLNQPLTVVIVGDRAQPQECSAATASAP
ncbi:SAF domain-containing protein [Corynebacterium macginleyi]|uniref:Flagellar biosynthesis protein FlgA n=1 Tax=Corynebacterium macginleyi TaxID=38290 RepID=A0A3M0FZI2_9CORY|nr:SAF domain-containing protein [Corynebacterium macginleyi]MBK4145441.1 flagellar biosynthesis protein FlgA [Corynebacterium macginleyi]MBK4151089.1 flagellar biosynthesis protein FlgA [Corynebacterium macginleyi]MBK4157351.1 flagellar biosynthesis protein FlgA [Corynebacterium macginleyi]MBK4160459.1 flagellar biosynthesis protein FlgA [Corynebacterium macginleyi]MBK4165672.1 flagellar biosynthesis protein FlgA [Corynebacterium macginleyi]